MTLFTALPGLEVEAPKPHRPGDHCPDCGIRVRRIIDADVTGLPAMITFHHVDMTVALLAVAHTGRTIYVHRRHKRSASWIRLDAARLGNAHAHDGEHHLDHVCGRDPPAPPPTPDLLHPADNPPPPF